MISIHNGYQENVVGIIVVKVSGSLEWAKEGTAIPSSSTKELMRG